MGVPAFAGSTWTSGQLTNDDTFASLANWNYGITDNNTSGSSGGYWPWAASGTAPYFGSYEGGPSDVGVLDYDLPGNVSQTSTAANTGLFSTYAPQTFSPSGCGVTLNAVYTGPRAWATAPYGNVTTTWTSGAINSYNHISFPTAGRTDVYVQVKAQMMGFNGSDNGAWNALWFLGQGNQNREIDLQETGLASQSPNQIVAHLQTPQQLVASVASAANLSSGYHVYGMDLNAANGVITVYLDNVPVGSATVGQAGPYFLIMNGAIASGIYGAAPASDTPMQMSVAEVQVYQR
jgi:hypothetical protein